MKKILSLAIAFTVTLSLSACAARNNRIYNRTGVGDNTGISTRRLSDITDINNRNGNYRDGVYTGYGNGHRNGNERATVQIRNGRIVDIDLSTVNQQGTINNTTGNRLNTQDGTITGRRIDNQAGTNIGLRNDTVTGSELARRNVIGNREINTPGAIPWDTSGNFTGGNNIGNTTGGLPGNIVGNGTVNMKGYGGGAMGTPVGTTLDGVRTSLENTMIQQQTYDVNITNRDTTTVNTVNNWKLAVRRALEQARR